MPLLHLFCLNKALTTSPFANESKNKDGAAITICSLCNLDITTAILHLRFGYFLRTCSSTKPHSTVHWLRAASNHYDSSEHNIPLHLLYIHYSFSMLLLGYLQ